MGSHSKCINDLTTKMYASHTLHAFWPILRQRHAFENKSVIYRWKGDSILFNGFKLNLYMYMLCS